MELYINNRESNIDRELKPSIWLRVHAIEGMTGLLNLEEAFHNRLNLSEIELIIDHLERKYGFQSGDPYNFIVNIARFSMNSLKIIEADYPE